MPRARPAPALPQAPQGRGSPAVPQIEAAPITKVWIEMNGSCSSGPILTFASLLGGLSCEC
jgi:hypothetical protein